MLDDDEYYIGQVKKGLRHGKGIHYYSDGNIRYEGEYVDDKEEGNGKLIYENGDYYIGQFKNGMRHGKGVHYYKNGNISRYEGELENDKYNGQGKLILGNGCYYIGPFKNGLIEGFGKHYYADGTLALKEIQLKTNSKVKESNITQMVNLYMREILLEMLMMEKENSMLKKDIL